MYIALLQCSIEASEVLCHRSMPVAAGASAQTEATLSVELPKSLQTADQLLTQRQPLHLVLMRTFPHHADSTAPAELERHNLESEVLGTAYYDWREVRPCLPSNIFLAGQLLPMRLRRGCIRSDCL